MNKNQAKNVVIGLLALMLIVLNIVVPMAKKYQSEQKVAQIEPYLERLQNTTNPAAKEQLISQIGSSLSSSAAQSASANLGHPWCTDLYILMAQLGPEHPRTSRLFSIWSDYCAEILEIP